MTASEQIRNLEKQVRTLRRMVAGISLLLLGLIASAFRPGAGEARFTEIEVERINVVESDGRYALVIGNAARLPGPIIRGHEYPAALSSGRERSSGIIFFNHEGTEAGGLTYGSSPSEAGHSAAGSFTFDRMNQEQVVQLSYLEGNGYFSGLQVWDRPEHHIEGLVEAVMASRSGEIDQAEFRRRAMEETQGSASRLRLGSSDRTALLELNDTRGATRIRLAVDSLDVARLEILDPAGQVLLRLPGD